MCHLEKVSDHVPFYSRDSVQLMAMFLGGHTGQLPPITLSGDHNQLHITFQLPAGVVEVLPEALASGMGLKIIPVLFNKGLAVVSSSALGYVVTLCDCVMAVC